MHLRPTASIASLALLPGDPGRALALAQDLLAAPRMANHARGLWGYTDVTADGLELTIQATGVGGPSIAIVIEELAGLGTRAAIRIGTCHALDGDLAPGQIVIPDCAVGADGTSRALAGGKTRLEPDRRLLTALKAAAPRSRPVTVASTDLYYDPAAETKGGQWLEAGAQVVDLGTAAACAAGRRAGVAVAALLVVSRAADGVAVGDDALQAASLRAGRSAVLALAAHDGGADGADRPSAQESVSETARLS